MREYGFEQLQVWQKARQCIKIHDGMTAITQVRIVRIEESDATSCSFGVFNYCREHGKNGGKERL